MVWDEQCTMTPGSAATLDTDDEDASPGHFPTKTREGELPRVLALLSAVLDRLIARNEQYTARGSPRHYSARKLTIFHGLKPPSISIAKYLERIFKYTSCSSSCFVVGYVYIDRLVHKHPDLPITTFNVHRLLVTSVMVASKVLDDVHFNNAFFARVGGISTAELNRLELEFLFRLDFRLLVNMQEFESYCTYLDREVVCSAQRIERTLPAFEFPADHKRRSGNAAKPNCSMSSEVSSVAALLTPQSLHSPTR